MSGGRRRTTRNCGLAPLGKRRSRRTARRFSAGERRQPHALKQLILEKTEGTPFFMEEVVQTLAEEGALLGANVGTIGWARTRPNLAYSAHGARRAGGAHRPPRPDEKALLQQLAVIGREFPLSLIRQVITQPEEELYRLLSSLQRKEFLYEQPAFPEVEYIFKHALTQEVAYGTVLQERRKALHERTAQAIESPVSRQA